MRLDGASLQDKASSAVQLKPSAALSARADACVESPGLVQGSGRSKSTGKITEATNAGAAPQSTARRRDRLPRDRWDVSRIAPAVFISLGGGEPNDDKIC